MPVRLLKKTLGNQYLPSYFNFANRTTIANRLHKLFPKAKILLVLRNQVDLLQYVPTSPDKCSCSNPSSPISGSHVGGGLELPKVGLPGWEADSKVIERRGGASQCIRGIY